MMICVEPAAAAWAHLESEHGCSANTPTLQRWKGNTDIWQKYCQVGGNTNIWQKCWQSWQKSRYLKEILTKLTVEGWFWEVFSTFSLWEAVEQCSFSRPFITKTAKQQFGQPSSVICHFFISTLSNLSFPDDLFTIWWNLEEQEPRIYSVLESHTDMTSSPTSKLL